MLFISIGGSLARASCFVRMNDVRTYSHSARIGCRHYPNFGDHPNRKKGTLLNIPVIIAGGRKRRHGDLADDNHVAHAGTVYAGR